MIGTVAASCVRNFWKAKGKECGACDPSPPYKPHKGAKYGIPDLSWRRINDGALRAHHSRLSETNRMVNDAVMSWARLENQVRGYRRDSIALDQHSCFLDAEGQIIRHEMDLAI